MAHARLTPVPEGATLLTLAQAADRVQIHSETLRLAIARKEIAHIRIGNKIRIRPEALDAWLGRNTVTTSRVKA